MLRVHILPTLGERRVGRITRGDVQALVNTWAETAAPRTVRRRFGVLASVFIFAMESDWVARSPARGAKLPPSTRRASRHLEPDEVAAVAEATAIEYRPMVWLGAFLGLRWSEVAGLRVGQLDLLRRTVSVAEAVTRDGKGRTVFTAPKSTAGNRTLAMPAARATCSRGTLHDKRRPRPILGDWSSPLPKAAHYGMRIDAGACGN